MHQLILHGCFICFVLSRFVLAAETTPVEGLRSTPPQCFALTSARIVCQPGEVRENATLVVRDGMIVALGEAAVVPADAKIIDATGKTIFAGFINGYTDVAVEAAAAGPGYWNSQITPQRSVAGNWVVDRDRHAELRKQGIAACLVAPADGIIRGQSMLATTGDGEPNELIVVPSVAQHLRLTIGWGRRDQGYPNSPMGAVALARQAMLDAQWYRQAHDIAKVDPSVTRPEHNAALAELAKCFDPQQLVVATASDEQFSLRADRFAREFGLRLALLGSGREYRQLEEIVATGRTIIVPVDFPKPPEIDSPESAANASLVDLMHWHFAPTNPSRLVAHGASILFTTDGLSDLDDFVPNIRKAVKRGLAADEALAALTTHPARLFDVDDRLGSLAVGKAATFVVASGDLFVDAKAKVEATWIDGRCYESKPGPLVDFEGQWAALFDEPLAGSKRWNLEVSTKGGRSSAKLTRLVKVKSPKDETIKSSEKGKPKPPKNSKDAKQSKTAADSAESTETMTIAGLSLTGYQLSGLIDTTKESQLGKAPISATLISIGDEPTMFGSVTVAEGETIAFTATRSTQDKPIKATDDQLADVDADDKDDEDGEADSDQVADASDEKSDSLEIAIHYPLGPFGFETLPEPESVAFTNATVWTGGVEATLQRATVLISGGSIVAVGTNVDIPKGTRRIDCKGKHITAGIIDCHSHIATDGGINESGQAITAEVRVGDFVDARDINIYRQLAGGVTAINVLHGSANPIGGQNQVIKMRWGHTGEAMKMSEAPPGIKFALGENVKQSNWGSEYRSRYPQTRMGVDEIMIDEFEAAKKYTAAWSNWNVSRTGLPPRRDLQSEAVAQILAGDRWIHCHSYRQSEIIALLRTLERYHIQIGTLQHILEGYKTTPEMVAHGAMASSFADWWAYKFEVYDAIPHNGALMHKSGIVVSFNSDDAELGRHLNHEAAKAIKYGGVAPEEAWKFVTLNPARQLRIEQHTGSLEAGKQADLVVWSGPPMSTLSRCEQTWVDGTCYFDIERDRQLRQRDAQLRHKLVRAVVASGDSPARPGDNRIDESRFWPRHDEYCVGHDHDHGQHDHTHHEHTHQQLHQ
jgi:N-acetylglucosamine-6-phosphate deacetylase